MPTLDILQDINLCEGENKSISFTGSNISTVTWDAPNGNSIGMDTESGKGNIPIFTANSATDETQSIVITVKPLSTAGCEGKSQSFTVTVHHKEELTVDLGNDTIICRLDSMLLDAGHPNVSSYLWQDNSTGMTYTVYREEGEYWVIVKARCNEKSDTINISHYKTLTVNLGKDLLFCPDDVIYREFNVTTSGASSYLWQDGSTLPTYIIEDTGTYKVTISNICISVSDEISVKLKDCNVLEFWIPNAFKPDENGINDIFKPEINNLDFLTEYEMAIYDRWGKLLFITRDYQTGWNGKYENKNCSTGVYTAIIKYKDHRGGYFIKNAAVTLLR